jgi:hypothetical protein
MSSEGMPTVRLDSGMVPPRWEYRVVHIHAAGTFNPEFDIDEIGEYLNGVGDDGWELVSLTPLVNANATRSLLAVLKRQRHP